MQLAVHHFQPSFLYELYMWIQIYDSPTALLLAPPMKEGAAEEALTHVKTKTPVALKSRPKKVCLNSPQNRPSREGPFNCASHREQLTADRKLETIPVAEKKPFTQCVCNWNVPKMWWRPCHKVHITLLTHYFRHLLSNLHHATTIYIITIIIMYCCLPIQWTITCPW